MHAACKKADPAAGQSGHLRRLPVFDSDFRAVSETMLCVLLGAAIIVALGIFDDVLALGASSNSWLQIVAAAIPVSIGDLQIGLFTNLNPLSDTPVCPSRHSGSAGHDYLDCRHHECGKPD